MGTPLILIWFTSKSVSLGLQWKAWKIKNCWPIIYCKQCRLQKCCYTACCLWFLFMLLFWKCYKFICLSVLMTVWSKSLLFLFHTSSFLKTHTASAYTHTYTKRSSSGEKPELTLFLCIYIDGILLYILYLCAHNFCHLYKRRFCITHGSCVNGPYTLKLSLPLYSYLDSLQILVWLYKW